MGLPGASIVFSIAILFVSTNHSRIALSSFHDFVISYPADLLPVKWAMDSYISCLQLY